jgi:hypothetical protein
MKRAKSYRGALAALSALAGFAAASLLAPSNAAAQVVRGLNNDLLLQRPGARLQVLSEALPGGAGADCEDNFTGSWDTFNLPTTAPNFSKIHDFTSFRLTAPFSCRNCLADVQNAIRNDGTVYVALAPAGYCATQFPTEGSPVIFRIPAAELQQSHGLTGTVFTFSGRPLGLPLLDSTGSGLGVTKQLKYAMVRRQPRFINVRLTISGGPVQGVLASFGIPAETGEFDVDGDADLTGLLAGAPGPRTDAVFPSGPESINTDVVLALATGVAASDDVTSPSDPNLPLGFVASCESLNALISPEAPPGL